MYNRKMQPKTLVISCLVATALFISANQQARAEDADFDTVYNIDYQLEESGEVAVSETIGIVNQSPASVPSAFTEVIKNISVYNIKVLTAKDEELQPEIRQTESPGETHIKVPITNPSIGKGKKTEIRIAYKTKDLASKTGRILTIHIPKSPISDHIQEYNVALKVPRGFGPIVSISPKPVLEKMEEEGYILLFNKQTLKDYGISATFGDYQIMAFDLKYTLQNGSVFAATKEFALPMPIQGYQEIAITSISPTPTELYKDADGNVLAVVKLKGKEKVTVTAKGKAKIYAKKINPEKGGAFDQIDSAYQKYTQPDGYWESTNQELKAVADSITADESSVTQNALNIYAYIVKNIDYDFALAKTTGIISRKGALKTLQDKKGLCLDFADLFVALARSAGIPAREVDGYAYAKEGALTPIAQAGTTGDFLHSWAQYYDPKLGWVAVDPTWGKTSGLDYFSKLDNNHLAFSIKGVDSESPLPAGAYKLDSTEKHVTITFPEDEFFRSTSDYNLENLPRKGFDTIRPIIIFGFVVGLGLCMILMLGKIRSAGRYK